MIDLADSFLRGSFPPLVTPFAQGEVDTNAFQALVDFQLGNGSHGVVVTGTSGEPAMLTTGERQHLYEAALEAANGRGPVIAATGAGTLDETLFLTRAATEAGAAAILVVTPYYSKPTEAGMIEYFKAVAGSTDLPVLIYHIPGRTGVTVRPPVLERIAESASNVVGVKHSAYDLLWMTEVIARLGAEFRVLVGVEELSFPMLAIGAAGLVNAAANIAPAAIRALYDAVATADLATARRLHFELFELNSSVFWETNPGPIKYLMWRAGLIATDEHRLPMAPPTREVRDRLDDLLQRVGPLVERPATTASA